MNPTVSREEFADLVAQSNKRGRYPVSPKANRTMHGIVFDSTKEMKRYAVLKQREALGEIIDLERQPSFPARINGQLLCTYKADFSYFESTQPNVRIIEDVKSTGTAKDPAYRLRKKAAQLTYGIKIKEII